MSDELEEQRVIAKKLREFFSDPNEAAVKSLAKIKDTRNELGGLIWQEPDGRYYASEPAGNERTRKFEVRVKLPKGAIPNALYHSHPPEGDHDLEGELFSPDDVDIADRMKLASYIKAMASGNIRRYEPGKSKTEPAPRSGSKSGGRGRVSRGDQIRAAIEELSGPLDSAQHGQ